MDGLTKLRTGDFNNMSQETLSDGTVIVTLSKRGEGKVYIFQVYDLYGKNEEVLAEEVNAE